MQGMHHFLYNNSLCVLITTTYISFYEVFVVAVHWRPPRRFLMPRVIDDTEILEEIASLPVCDEPPARALPLPPDRRERPEKVTGFGRLFTKLSRLRPQKPPGESGRQPFELPLDRLARQYPTLYLLSMAGAS
jgi:hypothetical protein